MRPGYVHVAPAPGWPAHQCKRHRDVYISNISYDSDISEFYDAIHIASGGSLVAMRMFMRCEHQYAFATINSGAKAVEAVPKINGMGHNGRKLVCVLAAGVT